MFRLNTFLRTLFTDIWVILDGKNGSGVPCTCTCLKAKLQKTMKIHSHGSIIWSIWEALWVRIAQIQKLLALSHGVHNPLCCSSEHENEDLGGEHLGEGDPLKSPHFGKACAHP
jgi:hypothetical protein